MQFDLAVICYVGLVIRNFGNGLQVLTHGKSINDILDSCVR